MKSTDGYFQYVKIAIVFFILMSQVVIFAVDREPWFDVAFSLETVHNLNDGVKIDFREYDVHPPLYYYFLSSWMKFNPWFMSEYHWAQESSVALMALAIGVIGISLISLFGMEGGLATLVFSIATTYLHYGTEVRMYAMIILLSAIIFYCVAVKRMNEPLWLFAGSVAMFMLPLVHYLAVMALPFFAVMLYVLRKRSKEKLHEFRGRSPLMIFIIIGLAGLFLALLIAMPQRARVEGVWFQHPTILDWAPSMSFSLFFMEQADAPRWAFVGMSILASIVVGILVYQLLRTVSAEGDVSDDTLILIFMAATGLAPLGLIIGAPLLGGNGFSNLYHHRFFLVLTWMFAASVLVMFSRWVARGSGLKWLSAIAVLMLCLTMQLVYAHDAHHELQRTMAATPCTKERLQIAHESPFSSLPYDIYARENGCNWYNFVSTNLSENALHGEGGDAMPERIYYNQTLPEGDYYYVYAEGSVPVDGREVSIYVDDGVQLWYVHRQGKSEGRRTVWYDNKSRVERVKWQNAT